MNKKVSLLGNSGASASRAASELNDFFIPGSAEGRVVADLPVDRIEPDPDQPRDEWSKEDLDALENAIRPVGRIIQPIVVRPNPDRKGYYLIKVGEGRWRVSKFRMGFSVIPSIIEDSAINSDPQELFAEQVIENTGRVSMTPIQRARSLHRWMFEFPKQKTPKDAEEKYGLHKTTVSRLLKLLDAPEAVQKVSSVVSNLNTLSYLSDLSAIDEAEAAKVIEKMHKNEYPDAENRLRKKLKQLKTKADTGTEQPDNKDLEPSPAVQQTATKHDQHSVTEHPDATTTEPQLFKESWVEALAEKSAQSSEVKDVRVCSTDNANALIEIELANGDTQLMRLDYEKQVKLVALLSRCMES